MFRCPRFLHGIPCLALLVCTLLPCEAQDDGQTGSQFDWATHRSSSADLIIRSAGAFRQRQTGLDADEQRAWSDLLEEVILRHQAVRDEHKGDAGAYWEAAFYRYADIRQTAWEKGSLVIHRPEAKLNPFREADEDRDIDSSVPLDPLATYALMADIQNHPEAFVGKPVVLRGILQQPTVVTAENPDSPRAEGITLSLGDLYPLNGGNLPFAVVHAASVERTSGEDAGITAWPRSRARLPVLVKGWVVKLWDDRRPLIYCESVRQIEIQPPTSLIQQHTVSRQPLQERESWLYYSTLKTLETISQLQTDSPKSYEALFANDSPELAARRFLQSRLRQLITEIFDKAREDEASLEQRLETRQITEEQHELEMKRLFYQVQERRRRYDEATEDPLKFDTYVDLFLNPKIWQGQLITLRGHVRHVASYPAHHPEFRGRKLHELWLYTDDSQSNPAVVVTAQLPDEFPVNADLIDQVTVTGCVFKEYVYDSQKSRRVAPLILSGNVQWTPTDRHLVALRKKGHLATGSPLDQRAQLSQTATPPVTSLLLAGFVSALVLMILWGRAQRDRRERRNLLNRITEKPEFETSLDGGYAPRVSDYTSGYDL